MREHCVVFASSRPTCPRGCRISFAIRKHHAIGVTARFLLTGLQDWCGTRTGETLTAKSNGTVNLHPRQLQVRQGCGPLDNSVPICFPSSFQRTKLCLNLPERTVWEIARLGSSPIAS